MKLNKRNIRMLGLACLATMILLYIKHTTSFNSVDVERPATAPDHRLEEASDVSSDPEVERQIEEIRQKLNQQEQSVADVADVADDDDDDDATLPPAKQGAGDNDDDDDDDKAEAEPLAEFDPEVEYTNILSISPVVIFSKTYCPFSKRLKTVFAESYGFEPAYTVVELDKHTHGSELQQYIAEQTGRRTVPNVMVAGVSRGGCDDFLSMHQNDKLVQSFNEWTDTVKVTRL